MMWLICNHAADLQLLFYIYICKKQVLMIGLIQKHIYMKFSICVLERFIICMFIAKTKQ